MSAKVMFRPTGKGPWLQGFLDDIDCTTGKIIHSGAYAKKMGKEKITIHVPIERIMNGWGFLSQKYLGQLEERFRVSS